MHKSSLRSIEISISITYQLKTLSKLIRKILFNDSRLATNPFKVLSERKREDKAQDLELQRFESSSAGASGY